jgi:hypothetical protein
MGTSTDRGGGSGGAWTPLKRAATSFMNAADGGRGTSFAGRRLLARHVPVLGGAAGAVAGARAGRAGAQRLGSLLSRIADDGLATALTRQGLADLVGGDRFTVLDALANLIAGDGADLDAQAARDATFDVLAELFPDADSWADLDAVRVDADEVARLLELFLSRYIYNRIPVIAERLPGSPTPRRPSAPRKTSSAWSRASWLCSSPAARCAWTGTAPREGRSSTTRCGRSTRPWSSWRNDVTTRTARFRIRAAPFTGHADAAEWLLDWAPGSRAETIEFTPGFFAGWQPGTAGAELLRFAAGVYCVDRVVPRRESPDAWTRDLEIAVPVIDPDAWGQAPWPAALGFLTGDRWTVQPYPASGADPAEGSGLPVDAVSLFSGGLDSLCGVIDLLERNSGMRLLLIAHYEGGKASTAQQALHGGLADAYGAERVVLRRMFCRPAPFRAVQERPLPPDRRERTTRSRSLLFLAGALAAAASCSPDLPVYMPENGWISLNVPLTRARTGSASTRTTHPHFLSLLAGACRSIGITNPVHNPYRLRTKGEMLADCSNPLVLARLAPASISCAHPETPRWRRQPQGNCGYCLPCLVRRAALARIGHDRGSDYAWDALTDPALLNPGARTSADLRATVPGVSPHRDELDIVRNAPLPPGEHHAYLQLWRRGAQEIRTWLAGCSDPLTQLTAAAWRTP